MFSLSTKSKFFGPKTISNRDYISHENSIFNNKTLVEKDVGKNKKIYIRRDKIDFTR